MSEVLEDNNESGGSFKKSKVQADDVITSYEGAYDTNQAQDYYKAQVENGAAGAAIDQQYKSQAENSVLAAAKNVYKNASESAEEYTRAKYQAGQQADKQGWSGGYVMDTNRQLDYLRSSIQADIYGQKELQKLGYKSALFQAAAAADQQKDSLALERYRQALSDAVTLSNVTGTFVAPQIADMASMYNAAQAAYSANSGDEKAKKTIEYLQGQFDKLLNGENKYGIQYGEGKKTISAAGIKTLAAMESEAQRQYYEAQAAYYEVDAEASKLALATAALETYDETSTDIVPVFAKDKEGNYTKVAAYKGLETLAAITDEEQITAMKTYFESNADEMVKVASAIFNKAVTSYASSSAKSSGATLKEYLESYSGMTVNDFMKKFASGTAKTSIELNTPGTTTNVKLDKEVKKDENGNVTDVVWKVSGNPTEKNDDAADDVIVTKDSAEITQTVTVGKDSYDISVKTRNNSKAFSDITGAIAQRDLVVSIGDSTYNVEPGQPLLLSTLPNNVKDKLPKKTGELFVFNGKPYITYKNTACLLQKATKGSQSDVDSLTQTLLNLGLEIKLE